MSVKLCKKLFLFLFVTHSLFAAFEPKGIGTAYLGAGSAGLAGSDDAFAVFRTPAKLTWNTESRVRLFYKNYYGIKNLNQISLEARFPVWGQPFAVGINRYGISSYNESELRMGSAIRLFDALDLGGTLNIYSVSLKNYGYDYTFGFTFAAVYAVFKNIRAGFTVENLNEPELGQAKEKLPLSAALGISYAAQENVEILLDLVKEQDFDFDFRGGVAVKPLPWTVLRFGYKNLEKTYSLGFSIHLMSFDLGYAFEYHTILGGSNAISMGYVF